MLRHDQFARLHPVVEYLKFYLRCRLHHTKWHLLSIQLLYLSLYLVLSAKHLVTGLRSYTYYFNDLSPTPTSMMLFNKLYYCAGHALFNLRQDTV
jgi:hypothetical protein